MTVSQKQSRRKSTGGRTSEYRKRRMCDDGRESFKPTVGAIKVKKVRTMGGNTKMKALSYETANIYVPKDKKHSIVKIKNVVENKANINFVRRNILTKGTIIDTDLGKAKVTSRPGQEGVVNAVLLE